MVVIIKIFRPSYALITLFTNFSCHTDQKVQNVSIITSPFSLSPPNPLPYVYCKISASAKEGKR